MNQDPAAPKRYLTFLFDLTSQAENKALPHTVRYAPDSAVPPPFAWRIIRDAEGNVIVRAHVRGKQRSIATGRWSASGIHSQRQLDRTEPNGNQWKWIGRALAIEGEKAEALQSSNDTVEQVPRFSHEPAVPESDQATRPSPSAPVSNKHAAREFLTYMAIIGALTLAILGLKRACAGSSKQAEAPPAPVTAEPPRASPDATPVPEPPIEARVAQAATFAEAIALAKPAMTDSPDELPAGAALLARYRKVRWSDVETPETTVAKVQKDSEAERGKRVCGEGEIERITRRDVDRRKAFVGRLVLADGDALAFVAVGTTGELVKRDRAKLCGVVTGMAGTDVAVLGMFDLPENRMPQVEQ